jgi:uncharacterized membrane-anchored protein
MDEFEEGTSGSSNENAVDNETDSPGSVEDDEQTQIEESDLFEALSESEESSNDSSIPWNYEI